MTTKPKKKTRRVLIGYVGVDSGQLLITDPCYIGSLWKNKDFQDIRIYTDKETGKTYQYKKDFEKFQDKIIDGKTVNELIEEGRLIKKERKPSGEYSYDGACQATIESKDGGGQLHYPMGHVGAGVAVGGFGGDGQYPVYATLIDDGDKWGEYVSKVEVKFR